MTGVPDALPVVGRMSASTRSSSSSKGWMSLVDIGDGMDPAQLALFSTTNHDQPPPTTLHHALARVTIITIQHGTPRPSPFTAAVHDLPPLTIIYYE